MFVRKSFTGLVAAALVGSALAVGASPASAAVEPDDTTFTATLNDLIGVGSDTSQHTLKLLADGWNAQNPAPSFRVATFAALGGGTIPLPSGDIIRPNGSGAGKALLYGAANNTDIDFARSSSGPSTNEVNAGLQNFPFALDTLAMAVSNTVPSNAPASLTEAQIVGIYKGDITNWSEVGGTAGVIAPKIPQPGSGTRSFFESELKRMNGGVKVDLAASVTETQEHDDTDVKNDPNAVAPFSIGRAQLLGTTLRIEEGFAADRALYNVVRGTDVGDPKVQAVFGENGFVCSTEARSLIEESGFQQLATPDRGGVCGVATQTATTNFTLNEAVLTTTTLSGASPAARTAKLTAVVSGSTAPSGAVDFFEGQTLLANDVPLVSARATYTVSGAAPGQHTYRAVFEPAEGSAFEPSEATSEVLVKTSASLTESFPAAVEAGKRAKGTVKVSLDGIAKQATGRVTVKLGRKTVGSGTLDGGKITLKLAALPQGKNVLKAIYSGDANAVRAKKKFTIKQK